jgi:hypothetical protein
MRLPEGKRIFLFTGDPCLFVGSFKAAPIAELLKFDLPLHDFLIFVRIIITPFANGTTQRYEPIGMFDLCHGDYLTMIAPKRQIALFEPMVGIEPTTYSFIYTSVSLTTSLYED